MFEDASDGRETKYVYLGSQRIAQITQKALTTTTMFYHTNHLGSAHVMTNGDGDVKEIIEYDPWGKRIVHDKYGDPEEVAWHYFTGHYEDDESGLIFMQARYYDPSLGRFITPDSIVAYPANPQNLNRYSYVHNNPVNLTDPTGNFAWFIPLIVGAIKGALIGATIGAGLAAITGGNIGQGAMLGAISGAFFGGTNGLIGHFAKQGVNFSTGLQILAHAEAGAYAGAVGAAAIGSDPLRGAGFGALSGAAFGGIGKLGGESQFWNAARIPLAGAAGGAISELAGGSFIDGFIFASSIASADFIYRAILSSKGHNRGASMRTATKSGKPKLDQNGNLINDKPLHADLDISQPGVPANPVGTNTDFFEKFITSETSPVMNFAGKNVPGVQGLSLAHDITGHFFANTVGKTINGLFFNVQTMPPVYGLNFAGSAINDNPSFIGIYTANRQEN